MKYQLGTCTIEGIMRHCYYISKHNNNTNWRYYIFIKNNHSLLKYPLVWTLHASMIFFKNESFETKYYFSCKSFQFKTSIWSLIKPPYTLRLFSLISNKTVIHVSFHVCAVILFYGLIDHTHLQFPPNIAVLNSMLYLVSHVNLLCI